MFSIEEIKKEPLPGYRLIEPIGRGGFGHVWKCEAPGGLFKAMKFVYGNLNGLDDDAVRPQEELRAIEHIKTIRHPFLLSTERVEIVDGQLIIVMELADKNLYDLLQEHQKAGREGIPREELLRYMRETAEVLDLMNLEHGLQHLDIKPQNIFLVRNHVKVADFGLVQSLAESAPIPLEHDTCSHPSLPEMDSSTDVSERMHMSAITPLYASPELFQGIVSHQCDQYSLAIVFQELLTGCFPFNGKNVRQLILEHSLQKPSLQSLPPRDRPIVEKALSKAPEQRFPTCTDFILALEEVGKDAVIVPVRSSAQGMVSPSNTTQGSGGNRRSSPAPAEGKYLPGYQFIKCHRREPLIEMWEAEDLQGRLKEVQFLYGIGAQAGESEALTTLLQLDHPALLPVKMVSGGAGTAILIRDFIKDDLRKQYQHYQKQGKRGLPREELLNILDGAAQALDELAQSYQIQHLELSPKSILISGSNVFIGNFGETQLLWLPRGQGMSKASARYSAPELSNKRITLTCDQYSLAMIYQEMLTGYHPYRGRIATAPTCTARCVTPQDIAQAQQARQDPDAPNLRALTEDDRRVLAQALHDDPDQRFGSCTELLQALRCTGQSRVLVPTPVPDQDITVDDEPEEEEVGGRQRVAAWVRSVKGINHESEVKRLVTSKSGESLEGRFLARLPLRGLVTRLESFRHQWQGEFLKKEGASVVLRAKRVKRSWLPWRTRQLSLLIEVHWEAAKQRPQTATEIRACIAPENGSSHEIQWLEKQGEEILESLLGHLQGRKERRTNDRIYWPHPVEVSFIENGQPMGESVICQGKDLSPTGVGFYLPCHMPSSQVQLQLSSEVLGQSITLRGNIVRVHRCHERLFEVGARFE